MLHMHTVHSGCVVDLGGRGGVPICLTSLSLSLSASASAASVLPPKVKCSHLTIVLPLHMLACLLQTRCLG